MNFPKLSRLAAVAFLVTAPFGVANAADMPVKAPKPVTPVFDWNGFYIGGYAGAASMDQGTTSDPCNIAFGVGGCIVGVTGNYNGVAPVTYDMNSSFVGGGRIGYNWQVTPFLVLGAENEYGYMKLTGTANMNPIGAALGDTNAFTKIGNWYDAVTARAGMTMGQLMFFVRGGAAWTRENTGVIDAVPTGSTLNTTTSKTLLGWAAGGGIEYAFNRNWSMRADYLFLGIPPSYTVGCGVARTGGVTPIPGTFCSGTHMPGAQLITLGLNYRFH
jgi:outer membrane immunogenic protein